MKDERGRALAAAAVMLAELVGLGLLGEAMAKYPGGTSLDPSALGHHFWRNLLCDLTRDVALDGRPNPGAWQARSGLLVLAGALVAFWWTAPPQALARSRRARLARAAGGLSLAGMTAVFLLPQRFGALHPVAVFVAALFGLLAASLTVAMQATAQPPRVPVTLGVLTITGALVTTGLYARLLARGGPAPLSLTAGQKLTLIALVSWIGITCTSEVARALGAHAEQSHARPQHRHR